MAAGALRAMGAPLAPKAPGAAHVPAQPTPYLAGWPPGSDSAPPPKPSERHRLPKATAHDQDAERPESPKRRLHPTQPSPTYMANAERPL